MNDNPGVKSLVALGFSEVEAEVYAFLLQESPATGYRVAQALGRLPPIIYKALESLEAKGAVLAEKAPTRMYTPVSPDELLSAMKAEFVEREAAAKAALTQVRKTATDHRVYQLRDRRQVLERSRTMLRNCSRVATLTLFPMAAELLKKEMEAAGKRGVEVIAKVYQPTKMAKVTTVLNASSEDVMNKFHGQLLVCVTDGSEMLIAFMSASGRTVYHAVYTASTTLAYVFHAALIADIELSDMLAALLGAEAFEEVKQLTNPLSPDAQPKRPKKYGDLVPHYSKLQFDVPGHNKLLAELQAEEVFI